MIVINARCRLYMEGDHRVVVVEGLPVHRYTINDPVAEKYAMVFLADSGFAQQNELAKAFGRSERTLRRHQKHYAEGGMAALATRSGWKPGRRRIACSRLLLIRSLRDKGLSNYEIARRLGVTEPAIRQQVGPTRAPNTVDIPLPTKAVQQSKQKTISKSAGPVESAPDKEEEEQLSKMDEPMPMSLDVDPSNRTFDRLLACFGLIDDAAPVFGDAAAVPGAGVLFALPFLINSGIFQIARQLYGEIGPAFYGLRTTLLTMLLMALQRIKRPEWLKERDPVTLGRILGLDRAPEVKTLRRKLTRLASYHQAERLGAELARLRVEQRGNTMGFLYVDGHVRVYHGKRNISKTHVARRNLCMPATTDYWINDQAGDPVFVVTAEGNAGLVKMLPEVCCEIRKLIGDRRVTIVFDRGGWSPKLFYRLLKDNFDILTYRKGKSRRLSEKNFLPWRAKLDGRFVSYRLHERTVRFLKGKLRLRQVTRLTDNGHQTQILTSRWDLQGIEIAYRMFERWRQENFFKYMREEFLLDALVDYQIEPDDPTRSVPNPHRRAFDKQVRAARAEVAKIEQEFGSAAYDNPETKRPTMRGFKIAHGKLGKKLREAHKRLDELIAQRRAIPRRVEVRDLGADAAIKLATERKHLTDIIKMVAYQAESDLLNLLRPHYARADLEGRTLLHELFASSADIKVSDLEIQVILAPLSSPHRTLAIQAISKLLNETTTVFPGTNLRLRFAANSTRRVGMAFPGPASRNRLDHALSP